MRGATPYTCYNNCGCNYFNPRSPCGERRSIAFAWTITIFQSTLPVRGATRGRRRYTDDKLISIHAPRAGSDPHALKGGLLLYHFNPRSPCGERLQSVAFICSICNFNPRSPCGERLVFYYHLFHILLISIHAPRAGSDGYGGIWKWRQHYFNPRSPCGERQRRYNSPASMS